MTGWAEVAAQLGLGGASLVAIIVFGLGMARRQGEQADRILDAFLHGRKGDGNGTPDHPGVAVAVADAVAIAVPSAVENAMNGRLVEALAPIESELRAQREETRAYRELAAYADTRATQALEHIAGLPCVADVGDCPMDAPPAEGAAS